jgi:hypothetical protein
MKKTISGKAMILSIHDNGSMKELILESIELPEIRKAVFYVHRGMEVIVGDVCSVVAEVNIWHREISYNIERDIFEEHFVEDFPEEYLSKSYEDFKKTYIFSLSDFE